MLDRDAAVRNRQRVLQLLLLWQQHPNGSEQVEVYCWFAGSGLFWGSMPGKAGQAVKACTRQARRQQPRRSHVKCLDLQCVTDVQQPHLQRAAYTGSKRHVTTVTITASVDAWRKPGKQHVMAAPQNVANAARQSNSSTAGAVHAARAAGVTAACAAQQASAASIWSKHLEPASGASIWLTSVHCAAGALSSVHACVTHELHGASNACAKAILCMLCVCHRAALITTAAQRLVSPG